MDGDAPGSGIVLSGPRRLILYWRSTPDGRLVFGKGGGWMSRGNRMAADLVAGLDPPASPSRSD
jgi:hypothetical protein